MSTAWANAQVVNGGFEDVAADGVPAGWTVVSGFQAAAVTGEQPHSGQTVSPGSQCAPQSGQRWSVWACCLAAPSSRSA